MYKLNFLIPESHLNEVKQALFNIGVGRYENYDQCCWQTKGQGQFRPLEGSTPHIGNPNEISIVEEHKVEMLCEDALIKTAIQTLKKAHPYEMPAFEAWKVEFHG
tara:strand:- start:1222 stop:1536 length:315 start_codon:yes stop_codon:yes gene_type:complete